MRLTLGMAREIPVLDRKAILESISTFLWDNFFVGPKDQSYISA